MNKRGRRIGCLAVCLLIAAGLAACGKSGNKAEKGAGAVYDRAGSSSGETSAGPADPGTEEQAGSWDILGSGAETLFGRITAIEGSTITLALAEPPGRPEEEHDIAVLQEALPAGEAPGAGEPDMEKQPKPALPSNDGKNKPMPAGIAREAEELILTGEERVLTVTDGTIITIGEKSAGVNDLAVGDVVTVFVEGDLLNSVMAEALSAAYCTFFL